MNNMPYLNNMTTPVQRKAQVCMKYQTHVLDPDEPVNYAEDIKMVYPPEVVMNEPFVGFKVLCTDTQYNTMNPGDRLRWLDQQMPNVLRGKGVFVRETHSGKRDGIWLITFPVPKSEIRQALEELFQVMQSFEQFFGIVRDGYYDINVSGKCHVMQTEQMLQSLMIPSNYMGALVPSRNMLCSIGSIQRINEYYMCLRTRWNLNVLGDPSPRAHFEHLSIVSILLASNYHN